MSEQGEVPKQNAETTTRRFINICKKAAPGIAGVPIATALSYGILRAVGVDVDPSTFIPTTVGVTTAAAIAVSSVK